VITEVLTATVSGTVTQTALETFTGTSATATATVQAPAGGVGPFTTVMVLDGCPVTITVAPNEEATFTCFIEINDNSLTPDLVSSGIVNVTVGITVPGAAIVGLQLNADAFSGIVSGATGNVRCGAVNTNDTCDRVAVVITVRGASGVVALPHTDTLSVTANYVPDNTMLNLPAVLNATTLATVITQATTTGFVGNNLDFVIRCFQTAAAAAAVTSITPGPIVGGSVVQILPAAIRCEAGFLAPGDAASAPFRRAAPGTIEVSTLNGSLYTLTGGITTNLRIGCGTGILTDFNTATFDPNTCTGVQFSVAGIGVGTVEVRARYEPSSAAAAAGVREREAAITVAFIAPNVSISLLLNPNPVGVGATGTATARFNRTPFFEGELLINPSTGAPLFINLGSPLSGTVTFQTSNPSVASFVGGVSSGIAETTSTVASVTATTAATISVRCGSSTITTVS
jgi:hypothetical protein